MRKLSVINETVSRVFHLAEANKRKLSSLVISSLPSTLANKRSVCHVGNRRNFAQSPFLCNGGNKTDFSNKSSVVLMLALFCAPSLLYAKRNHMNGGDNLTTSCEGLEKVHLAKKDELKNGEMKEIKVRGEKDTVLLVHVDGKYYCLGPKCPHYSAPLKTGMLTKDYVTCPWHDAKFDLKTGECINGPSFDDIPRYEVAVEGNDIYAFLPKEMELFKKKKVCPCSGKCENKTILIVGGGAATMGALETFLKMGYTGKLVICSKDAYKPYDRPTLSKTISKYDSAEELYEGIKLKEDEYYKRDNINYLHDVSVERVDVEGKKAHLSNGQVIQYDKLLVTTGVRPSPSPLGGSNANDSGSGNGSDVPVKADNLMTLQSLQDHVKIASYAKEGSKCAIIGSSFIGCELSSALKKKNVSITMVSKDTVPFHSTFGDKIGSVVLDILKDQKVTFYGGVHPTEYIIDGGGVGGGFLKKVKSIHGVRLSNGEVIKCDYVVEALGCLPNSEFLQDKFKNEKKQVVVDKHFQVKGSSDVYAAGDVCSFPYFVTGEMINVCHWNVAIQQGRIAAHNMLSNDKKEFTFIPFFNTNIFGKNFRYCGFVKEAEKVIYEGDLRKHNFVAYFVKNDKVASILTLGNAKMAALNECLSKDKVPKVYELEGGLQNSDSMIASMRGSA
ncbi:Ferrodoxin reductase-like protein [Plasmodium coatneyi]|uniref:Ferrodoxin reductase-like protein n=1 Tax=Plasmodium coatneyi TaxID=208452 RepID=A0A1B1DTM7_9APIC|nr:Ferrodoxin reductase-like protein [Plasmodium coatneyi]ANQ06130.1 Ferrodoxin reductase-like protein [Plasmodium coatneyi]